MRTTTILAIDTASPSPAVTIVAGASACDELLPAGRHASEELLFAIEACLTRAEARLEDLSRIAVCSGPGSFTGVRVGLATAWGLSRALGIPAEAVSTLEVLAEAARAGGLPSVAAALDAGRGEIVWQRYDLEGPRARPAAEIARIRVEDAPNVFAGLPAACLPADLLGPDFVCRPLTAPLSRALAEAVQREPRVDFEGRFAAIYSRPSAAEEKHGVA